MRIAILGAGFTGLAAAWQLSKKGHKVVVFEKDNQPGGLAVGFKERGWKWSLEKHYHHLFISDWAIRQLAEGVGHKIVFKRPKTSLFFNNQIFQFDSPSSLLKFPYLSLVSKIRTIATLGFLRVTPFWRPLEKISAYHFLSSTMGGNVWKVLWKPLFETKFGKYAKKIPASWFWARIKKRSAGLGYPEGGFQELAQNISKACCFAIKQKTKNKNVKFLFNTEIVRVRGRVRGKIQLDTISGETHLFDKIVCTLPNFLFCKITKGLPKEYKKKLLDMKGLGALNLVLVLKEPFLKDGTYWLNINEPNFPFLAVVEHTNFIDKKHYGGKHIVYIGNYLPQGHKYYSLTVRQLLKIYDPFLKKINPTYQLSAISYQLFSAPFAQPIIPLNYSKIIPDIKTPIKGVYLANIQQVYPWDRGTNYAVALGRSAVRLLMADG